MNSAIREGRVLDARALDTVDRQLINLLQKGMPVCAQPFVRVGQSLELPEHEVLARLQRLLDIGILSRFGPMYQIERAGGRFTLAAIAVPPERFDEIAEIVNAFPEVAHNYERTHTLNMWFVLGTETPGRCADTIKRIEQATGLPVLDMPKQREFRVQLYFDASEGNSSESENENENESGKGDATGTPVTGGIAPVISEPANLAAPPAQQPMDNFDRTLMRATQAGLPLVSQPFAEVARQLGVTETEVMARFERWQQNGILRRIAAVPNHYALGYVHNGMTVWNVDDDRVDELGAQVAALGFVSHCYRRPRHLPGWSYNLFAMVHGRTREQTDAQIRRIAAVLGDACHAQDVLWSTRILKKTGLRISE